MSTTRPRRPYTSTRRAAGAAATRSAILDAALEAFRDPGYAATTVEAIATTANVSPKTVYAVFGNKRRLLASVLDRAIAGDDAPVPVLERPWVAEMTGKPDVPARLTILAREGAAILARRAVVDAVIARAASVDPEVAALAAAAADERRGGQAALLRLALAGHPVSDDDIDALAAIGSPEVHRALVDERGWSEARFAAWYRTALVRLFAPDD